MRSRLAVFSTLVVAAAFMLPASGQSPARCSEPQQVQSFSAGRLVPARGVACTHRTGFLTSETHLRVAPDGTVVQQPAQTAPGVAGTGFVPGAPGARPQSQLSPAGFAISRDGGSRFEMVLPSGLQWVASDGAIHFDSATGRLYYYALSPSSVVQSGIPAQDQVPAGYAHLLTSADGGRSWHHTQAPGYVESENPRFTSGRAPKGGDQPIAGESVAYWCGNTALFAYGQRDCYRTLDGGQTWQFRSTLLRRGAPAHTECGSNEESFNAGDGAYPQTGPDGTLWTLIRCGGKTFLARSTNEGTSFPVLQDAKGGPLTVPGLQELRVDSNGILYGAAVEGTTLLLRTSGDGGRTWSAPVDLIAPSLRGSAIKQWAFSVRGPGQVAASYLTARKAAGFNGSVTVTRAALARQPVFTTSTVYDGKLALVMSPQVAKDDYIDLDIGPDGSAWASFYGDCGSDPACATAPNNPMAKVSVLTHLTP